MSIGADLAAARRQAGLSVAQVSKQTRIRQSIIQSIEKDDFSACGADFYARGHIRAIARATGADAVPLVQEYDARVGTPPASTGKRAKSPVLTSRVGAPPAGTARLGPPLASTGAGAPGPPGPAQPGEHWKRNLSYAVLVLLVVALGVVVYRAHAAHHGGGAAAAGHHQPAATAHHAHHKHKASPAADHTPRHMVISVRVVGEPCWAELSRRGGGTIFEGVIYPGTAKAWTVRRDVILRLGNPAAVTLKIDGKRHARLGPNPVVLRLHPGHAGHSAAS